MKRTFRKFFNFGKVKAMISGGLGKKGPYVYSGVKHKSGLSGGISAGTQGRNIYASYNKNKGQVGIKYNFESKQISPKVKKPLRLL
jgi:hypothetical protein